MYKEIKPSERINNIIDSFWTFSKNKESENFKVLPDTCADLIFDIDQNKGFLSGIMTNYQRLELMPESNLIGIRFKTEKFGSLSKIPLNETKNLRIELSQIFPLKDLNHLHQLNESKTTIDRVNFLERFITTSFKENYESRDLLILSVVQNIRSVHGMVSSIEMAKLHHISLRQLERRFKKYMGLTIKEFSNIVRFTSAKKVITSLTETSLLNIAVDTGFSDHSHMTYEFKRISGENPSSFR